MRRPSFLLAVSLTCSLAVPALLGAAAPARSSAPAAPSAPAAATPARALGPSARAVAEPGTLRVLTYNICGSACPDSKGFDTRKRVDVVVSQAVSGTWQADQVHLQEVCRGQYDKVLAGLAPHGFTGRFTATEGDRGSCRNKDYGAAVLVRAKIADTVVLDVTQGEEPEKIKVPCVRSTLHGRDNWACSVHLYWQGKEPRTKQAVALAAQARKWRAQGIPVVLAGDFNASPFAREIGEFYTPEAGDGGHGRFVEGDERDKRYFDRRECDPAKHTRCRSGEPTFHRKKIDYIFFSEGDFGTPKADARRNEPKVSDHNLLRATATWVKAAAR